MRRMPTINPPRIDYYSQILATAPSHDYAGLREFLGGELPYVWLDEYIAMLPHQHNVHRISVEGFEYLSLVATARDTGREGLVPDRCSQCARLPAVVRKQVRGWGTAIGSA